MSFVNMGPMLKRAQAGKYGIAAFNMIDYNSARAIIEAAAELEAPMIVQVSTKPSSIGVSSPLARGCRCWLKVLMCQSAFTLIIATISTPSKAALMRAGPQ